MGQKAVAAVVALVSTVSIIGTTPEHASRTALLSVKPEDGYTLTDPNCFFTCKTQWTPNSTNSKYANVHASEEEGYWVPDSGYVKNGDNLNDGVSWLPNKFHDNIAHVVSSETQDEWRPDYGYTWQKFNEDGTPVMEGGVKWTPGARVPQLPHIYTTDTEGVWYPDAGYHFVKAGDLSVEANGPDWVNVGTGVSVGVLASGCSQNKPEDGFLTSVLVRPFCRGLRDEGFRAAAREFN